MKLNKDIDNTLTIIKNHLNKVNLFKSGLIPDLFFTKGHIEYDITFDKLDLGNAYHFASSFCVLGYKQIDDDYYLAEIQKTYSYARVGNKIVKKLRKRSNEKIEFEENDCLLVVCFLKLHIASYDIIE